MVVRHDSRAGSLPLLHALRNLHPAYPAKEWADILLADWDIYSRKPNFDPHKIAVVCNQAALIYFRLGDSATAERLCRRLIDLLLANYEESGDDLALHYAFQPLINLARMFNANGQNQPARAISDLLVGLMLNDPQDREYNVEGVGVRIKVRGSMQGDPDFVRFIWSNALIEGFKALRLGSVSDAGAFLERMSERCPREFNSLVEEGRCIACMETGSWEDAWGFVRIQRDEVDIQLIFLLHEARLLKQFDEGREGQELLCKIAALVMNGILKHSQPTFELAILRALLRMWGKNNPELHRAIIEYGRSRAEEALDQRNYQFFQGIAGEIGLSDNASAMAQYADYYRQEPGSRQYPESLLKLYGAILTDH